MRITGSASIWAARRSRSSRSTPAGREQLRLRVPSPRDDYGATLAAIAALVADAERRLEVVPGMASVGVGTPGSLSRTTGLLRGANSVWLNGQPLARDLEATLSRPVRITNDANCFALSEATDGAGAGAAVVFGVILGTGVGGGIVVDGRVLDWRERDRRRMGPQSAAVAVRRRAAGARLLLRPVVVHRDVAVRSGIRARPCADERRARSTPRGSSPRPCVAMPQCEASLARYEARLARALAHVINLLDPDVIVLGGGIVERRPSLRERARAVGTLRVLRSRRHAARAPRARRFERRAGRRVAVAGGV